MFSLQHRWSRWSSVLAVTVLAGAFVASSSVRAADAQAASAKKKKKKKAEPAPAAPAPAAAATPAPAAEAPAAMPVTPTPTAAELAEEEAEEERSRTAGLGRVKIEHVNDMVSNFKLVKVFYTLNSHSIYPDPQKPPADFSQKTIPIWEGVLPIGDNDLQVTAVYKGVGSALFAYLNDMTFTKTDKTTVKVTEGQETTVTVISEEDTSPFTMTEDRPRFDYRFASAPMKTTANQ
jgi:hypothetical protein